MLPAWELATDNQLARIQAFIDHLLNPGDVAAQSIATSKDLTEKTKGTAEVIKQNAEAIRGDLKNLKTLEKRLDALEAEVIAELKKDLKTKYTVENEPSVNPSTNWDGYLNSLGKDALGETKPSGQTWPAGPGKGVTTHAHHIVLKNGNTQARTADPAFVARQILWEYADQDAKLNPYTGQANLVWVPNWSHTNDYAGDVLKALLKVKDESKTKVINTLKSLAERFINGEWHA